MNPEEETLIHEIQKLRNADRLLLNLVFKYEIDNQCLRAQMDVAFLIVLKFLASFLSEQSAEFDQRDQAQLASLERLRAIADNSAQCVDKLCGCNLQSNIEKSVEEVIYEEYLPILLSQMASRSTQSSSLPLLLTDKNSEIQCAICPDDKRFKVKIWTSPSSFTKITNNRTD